MRNRLLFFLTCMMLSASIAFAQKTVTGQVIEAATGEPVIGAAVKVLGTSLGQATDVNGQFKIANVPDAAKTLLVSYLGMKDKEVAIKSSDMKIYLEIDVKAIDEVFVVAYGTATKETFTGAASHINAETIENRQISDITQALAGNVAGVQTISSNGQPGTSATVRVRGFGSINASMTPLYVVDGVPYDGDIAAINPQDIEQLSVLKDAAAAALYGARGANGVILVTTKSGNRNQDAKVTFEARLGSNSREISNYDVLTSSANYLENLYSAYYNAAKYNLGYGPVNAHSYASEKTMKGPGYQVYTVPAGESFIGVDGKINPNATLGYSDGVNYFTPDDWSKETFRNGLRQEYNVNVQGGTDKMTYYLSAGYLNDEGVIDHSSFERTSTRATVDYKVKSWLKIGTNLAFNFQTSSYPDEQTTTTSSGNAFYIANNIAPIYPFYVRNADGSLMYDRGNKVYDYGDGSSTGFARNWMSISNPTGDLVYTYEKYLMDIFNSQWYAILTPVAGLTLTARLGLNLDNTRYNMASSSKYGQSASYGGEAVQDHTRTRGLTHQYTANYKLQLNDVHNIDLLLGYEGYTYESEESEAYGQNLYKEGDYTINNTIDQRRGFGSKGTYSTEGIIFRGNYDYAEKYFGSVSFRRDGSSRFHPDNRWGNFWSASAAWNIGKENFMEDIEWVDFLKLRASFGQQGNDGIGNSYAYIDQYSVTGADGVFSDGTLLYKANKDLTWEKSNNFDVAVDFELWGGKLSGSIDYFNRTSKDMLYYKPTQPSLGYSSIPMNIGSMRNSGIEIDLASQLVNTRDISWTINANATFLKNKIIDLAPELNGQLIDGTRIYKEGESMYQLYLVKYAGVNPGTGEALYWAKPEIKDAEGNVTGYEDYEIVTTDWNLASHSDRQVSGNLLPKMNGGFGTSLKFYGFDFGLQCSYQLGGKIFDSGYQSLMHGGATADVGQNWHKDIANAWTAENTNTDIPRLCNTDKFSNSTSDRWLISSNYLSLNNITLGYTLPMNLTRSLDIESIRFYASADNLAVLSARKGLDPRMSFTSATTSLYTAIRTISFGLKVTF